jgi:hypothetical protein
MNTLEVYVEIISYFGQMHDYVVRVDGKYRNRPGLRFQMVVLSFSEAMDVAHRIIILEHQDRLIFKSEHYA